MKVSAPGFAFKAGEDIVNVTVVHLRPLVGGNLSFVKTDEDVASAGPRGEPIATPSIWRNMVSLKENSTPEVASLISSLKESSLNVVVTGSILSFLYRASAQISITAASGTLVN